MKRLLLFIFLAFLCSCAQPKPKDDVKKEPQFSTEITDPELKVISEEFFHISRHKDLVFSKKVSMGFSDIERGSVIGTCTFGNGFREIDLDKEFWARASWASKVALVYHEMTHCYCERGHDFDEGVLYPDNSIKFFLDRILNGAPFTPLRPEGYLEDGCPKSIMYPIIVDPFCFERHYKYYVQEMFNRCDPW